MNLHEPIIVCQNLTKTYRVGEVEVPALRGVNLTVQRGEMVAIMGASGSGKSTLMNILGCMDVPTGGKFYLHGEEAGQMNPRQLANLRNKKIGFVFQRYNLLSRSSSLHNVMLPMQYAGIDGPEAEERAKMALTQVGLEKYMSHRPNQMSGGQQQRVAIARALVNNPLVIFADEPTGALDTATSQEVMELLRKIHRERGTTLIIVTHEPDIATYCQRLVRLRDGLIVEDGTVQQPSVIPALSGGIGA